MKIVFSLGGSVIIPDQIDIDFLKEFKKLLLKFLKNNYRFVVVCGGGKICRTYINSAIELGIKDREAHTIGIDVTKLNAKLLHFFLGKNSSLNFGDPRKVKLNKKIVITAGYRPGWNTDVDAAYICKSIHSKTLINISNTIGVYDKDPRENKDAKLISEMSWKEFIHRFGSIKMVPGANFIFHPLAARICALNKITAFFISKDLSNLRNLLNGKKFVGTKIF